MLRSHVDMELEEPELGTVYVDTVTRLRELGDGVRSGGGGDRGTSGASSSSLWCSLSANGSSSFGMAAGIETTGRGEMLYRNTMRGVSRSAYICECGCVYIGKGLVRGRARRGFRYPLSTCG